MKNAPDKKNQSTPSFAKNRWRGIPQNHLPCSLIINGTLSLKTDAVTVYMALLHIHRAKMLSLKPRDRQNEIFARVMVGHTRLMEITGFSINKITSAVKELREVGLVEPVPRRKRLNAFRSRRKRECGGSMTTEYLLLNPDDPTKGSLMPDSQTNVIPASGIRYFTYPASVITKTDEVWSLANLTSSETRVYVSLLWLVNQRFQNENRIDATVAVIGRVSGLTSRTVGKALDGLESRGLIRLLPASPNSYIEGQSKPCSVELCDPMTGCPISQSVEPQDHPSNYRLRGRRKRPILNGLDPEGVREMIYEANQHRGETVTERADKGELVMRCPFHADDTPSLSANIQKNGCWYCHGCKKSGSLHELLAGLRGVSVGEGIQLVAASKGFDVEYQDPDNGATIYQYRDAKGNLQKEVLRRIDKNGKKVFTQRRPGPDGMVWNTDGLPPLLYNLDRLERASTVCITEGEKDADTVTNLQLSRWPKEVIAVTTGGADSWDANFAKQFHGKNVVVMPDADEAGRRYEDAVRASLDVEGIAYRVVKFDDVGAKDVSDFLLEHSAAELVQRIGQDWVSDFWSGVIPDDLLHDHEIMI